MVTALEIAWNAYNVALTPFQEAQAALRISIREALRVVSDTVIQLYSEGGWNHPIPGLHIHRWDVGQELFSQEKSIYQVLLEEDDPGLLVLYFEVTDSGVIIMLIQNKFTHRYSPGDQDWDARVFMQELSQRTGHKFRCSVDTMMPSLPPEAQRFDVLPQPIEEVSLSEV